MPITASLLRSSAGAKDSGVEGDEEPQAAVSRHRWGLLCMTAGVLFMVPDATLTRLVRGPPLVVAGWRMLLTAAALTFVLAARYGTGNVPAGFINLGPWGLVVGVFAGLSNMLFIVSVKMTSVAHVLLILATSPFWAALCTRLLLGVSIPCKTWIAMPIVLGGVALIVSNGLDFSSLGLGEAVAAAVPMMSGARRTIIRWKSDIDMLPALIFGSFLVSSCLLVRFQSSELTAAALPPLLLNSVVLLPLANALMYEGSRFLPSTESSLIMCTETALSPILAWAVLGDRLTLGMLLGGAAVIVTLAVHAVWLSPQQPPG